MTCSLSLEQSSFWRWKQYFLKQNAILELLGFFHTVPKHLHKTSVISKFSSDGDDTMQQVFVTRWKCPLLFKFSTTTACCVLKLFKCSAGYDQHLRYEACRTGRCVEKCIKTMYILILGVALMLKSEMCLHLRVVDNIHSEFSGAIYCDFSNTVSNDCHEQCIFFQ